MNLEEIVKQFKLCKYIDELGHPIENNKAFIELEKKAQNKMNSYIKGISFLCLAAFLLGAFSYLGNWAIYKLLDIINLLAVG